MIKNTIRDVWISEVTTSNLVAKKNLMFKFKRVKKSTIISRVSNHTTNERRKIAEARRYHNRKV